VAFLAFIGIAPIFRHPSVLFPASDSSKEIPNLLDPAETRTGQAKATCQPHSEAVVSELPIKRLMRATRKGQCEFAAKQENFAGSFISR
jgi:hypothetical protein